MEYFDYKHLCEINIFGFKRLLLLFVLVCFFSGVQGCNSRQTESPDIQRNIILMKYDPSNLSEDVVFFDISNRKITKRENFRIDNIREWNRNLRYIMNKKIFYLQVKDVISDDPDIRCMEPAFTERLLSGTSKKTYYFTPFFTYLNSPHALGVGPDCKSPKELREELENRLVFRRPEYFISYRKNEIIAVKSTDAEYLGAIFFFYLNKNPLNTPLNKLVIIKKKFELEETDIFNPLMSSNGKFIAYYTTRKKLIPINEDKLKVSENKYKKESDKVYKDNNLGWSLYLVDTDGERKPVKLASNYIFNKIMIIDSKRVYPIPHKCWSPDNDEILFVGSQKPDGIGGVYTVDLKTRRISEIFRNERAGFFNPGLEWTKYGVLITTEDSIYFKVKNKELFKLKLPNKINDLRTAKISSDGGKVFFFGRKKKKVFLFIYDLNTTKLQEKEIGEGEIDNYQGSWAANRDKLTVIKNEYDYTFYQPMKRMNISNW